MERVTRTRGVSFAPLIPCQIPPPIVPIANALPASLTIDHGLEFPCGCQSHVEHTKEVRRLQGLVGDLLWAWARKPRGEDKIRLRVRAAV